MSEDSRAPERERMVAEQIELRGVSDPRVLAAMRAVPRHEFVPASIRAAAYEDRPLPIGHGQTISQPYVVAVMTELARVEPGARVLEIGTGSGYQCAVLAELAAEVFSVEIVEPLGRQAAAVLARLGYRNVHLRLGDGRQGWAEEAPFDAVVATAAPATVPPALVPQLALGGRMVVPVGGMVQQLHVLTRTAAGVVEKELGRVQFVPMVGGNG